MRSCQRHNKNLAERGLVRLFFYFAGNAANKHDTEPVPQGLFAKLGVLVKKVISNCIE